MHSLLLFFIVGLLCTLYNCNQLRFVLLKLKLLTDRLIDRLATVIRVGV